MDAAAIAGCFLAGTMPRVAAAAAPATQRGSFKILKQQQQKLYRERRAALGPSPAARCIATIMLLLPGGTAELAGQWLSDDYE